MDPRNETWELAKKDANEALKFAKTVDNVWYRVQSMAMVAWHIESRKDFLKIVDEALDDARLLNGPNRIVSCSSWVVRAMTNRDDVDAAPTVQGLLNEIDREPNPVRGAEALLLLFEAVYPKEELKDMVLEPLLDSCLAMKSWKQPRLLASLAMIVAKDYPALAERVIGKIGTESTRRKAREAIADGKSLGPHEFFPHYAKPVD